MTAHAPSQGSEHIPLDEVLRLSILGNSGIGVKVLSDAFRDQTSLELTVSLLDRVTAACQQVGQFPSLFVDLSEPTQLPPRITAAITELIEYGIRPEGESFFCGVEQDSKVYRALEESGLLTLGSIDPGTTFLPAIASDREKFGRLATILQRD